MYFNDKLKIYFKSNKLKIKTYSHYIVCIISLNKPVIKRDNPDYTIAITDLYGEKLIQNSILHKQMKTCIFIYLTENNKYQTIFSSIKYYEHLSSSSFDKMSIII